MPAPEQIEPVGTKYVAVRAEGTERTDQPIH